MTMKCLIIFIVNSALHQIAFQGLDSLGVADNTNLIRERKEEEDGKEGWEMGWEVPNLSVVCCTCVWYLFSAA